MKKAIHLKSLCLLGLALLAGSIVTTSCSSDNGEEEGMSMKPDIALNKETLVLEVGSTERLVASFTPAEAPNKGHTWTSSAAAVASVDETGLVTAVAEGSAVITATALDGGKMASCAVQVVDRIVHVTQVRLDKTDELLTVGSKLQLTATVLPENATDRTVKWTSSDDAIATVDGNGQVTALAEGTATISAVSNDGEKRGSCQITVAARGVRFSTPVIEDITTSTAHLSGTIRPIEVTIEEAGVCYSTSPSPTVTDQTVVLSGEEVSYTLNGLSPATTYYVRFYALTDGKISYGEQEEFTTSAEISTQFEPTDVYENKLVLVSPAPAGVTSVNICYGTSPNPKITDYTTTASIGEDGLLQLTLEQLSAGKTYYLRSYTLIGESAVEYHDDEVAQKTIDYNEFSIEYNTDRDNLVEDGYRNDMLMGNYAYRYHFNIHYNITIPGTYKVKARTGNLSKNTVFNGGPIYIESGSGDFRYRTTAVGEEYGFPYSYAKFAADDIVFENLETSIKYHLTRSYFQVITEYNGA